ncbi:MAG: glutathione peroxidase [Succinivibrio sp.]|nr:glutathione peroxidase [Succinivibrio sp.]
MNIYDFELTTNTQEKLPLANFKGKVLVIVNTATHCGFTPQYEELEAIYEKYRDQGFEVIDIPCNQFYAQAPEDDAKIQEFCMLNYKTKFLRMQKSDVNGERELPLYTFLKKQQGFKGLGEGNMVDVLKPVLEKIDPDYAQNADIKWNFTKFVIDRNGQVVARFEPTADLADLEQCVKTLL